MIRVTENLRKIRDLLAKAANDAGRSADSVRLLAVSKKQPVSSVLEAAAAGQRDFGENQVQEGLDKIQAVANDELVWHFIGHLQTNKTKAVAEHFHWVHSVDRLKIARRLSNQRPESLPDLNICLEVNIDEEQNKSGLVTVRALTELAEAVVELPRLRLRGLMCLPAIRHDFDEQRVPFARLRELAHGLAAIGIETDTLSMGMSDDYRAAIFEGATIVRIGTAVFGPRQ
ncbi:MAG: YggS family pyridoxal phosphate-dependent enzyme [Gammaproteobacteria bacterium]|nr:YggS family pyridoxal phosphate-dependent enzyme [Gammaproteobacteria bacterium]MDH3373442.1 YggS family pyridoxal phosphate-dependent enzyme [Gammaproteobacteria bacterium]MDH3409347.1 YggS family pyridoxal phosphate-dependent enzyme [Gammaproteobacteria bacterium]MDH3553537.1 YggS family pyridoxal phosphate-dependent enzyme [Gammaproteobacteria bacterium]